MHRHVEVQRHMVFRNAKVSMGWMIYRQWSIEETVGLTFANETNVADFYSRIGCRKGIFHNASPKTILETLLMPVEVDFDLFQPRLLLNCIEPERHEVEERPLRA